MVMASALGRLAVAAARNSGVSIQLSKSVNNALVNLYFSRLRANPSSVSNLTRALATAAAPKKRAPRKTAAPRARTGGKTAAKKPKKKPAKKASRPKKVLTEKQKEAAKKRATLAHTKELKAQALAPPKMKTTNAYAIFLSQNITKGAGAPPLGDRAREVARKYREISPQDKEVSQYLRT